MTSQTQRVRMRSTRSGSLDGRDVQTYHAGEVYDLPLVGCDGAPGLAAVFLREGWAEVVPEPAPEVVPEFPPVSLSGHQVELPAPPKRAARARKR